MKWDKTRFEIRIRRDETGRDGRRRCGTRDRTERHKKIRDAGQDGTAQESTGRGTGRDGTRKYGTRDRTGQHKKVRDAGQDGMNFWLSRGALALTERGTLKCCLLKVKDVTCTCILVYSIAHANKLESS